MSSLLALFCLPSVKKHEHDFFLFRLMYNKTIIRFGFCDIQNNQGLGKGYHPQPSASADDPYFDLDYSGFTKTSSSDCLLYTYICYRSKLNLGKNYFNLTFDSQFPSNLNYS